MTHNNTTFGLSRQQEQQQKPALGSSKATGGKAPEGLGNAERERLWARVYRATHSDFKGRMPDGTQTLMSWAKYGGGLVNLTTISDAELIERAANN